MWKSMDFNKSDMAAGMITAATGIYELLPLAGKAIMFVLVALGAYYTVREKMLNIEIKRAKLARVKEGLPEEPETAADGDE